MATGVLITYTHTHTHTHTLTHTTESSLGCLQGQEESNLERPRYAC